MAADIKIYNAPGLGTPLGAYPHVTRVTCAGVPALPPGHGGRRFNAWHVFARERSNG